VNSNLEARGDGVFFLAFVVFAAATSDVYVNIRCLCLMNRLKKTSESLANPDVECVRIFCRGSTLMNADERRIFATDCTDGHR
jgi:hypothetical protein